MTPQEFKALLDVLYDINSNLEKIAKLESVLLPLKGLIKDQRAVLSEQLSERSGGHSATSKGYKTKGQVIAGVDFSKSLGLLDKLTIIKKNKDNG